MTEGIPIPPKYAPYVPLAMLVVQWAGRAFIALRNGGGVVGVWKAIVYGSTTVHNDTSSGGKTEPPFPKQ